MSAKLWEQALGRAKAKKRSVFEKTRRFFTKKPDARGLAPNRKGHGFHLLKTPGEDPEILKTRKRLTIGGVAAATGLAFVLLLLSREATPDFTVMLVTLAALCGMVFYDVASRRIWEKKLSLTVDRLSNNHDRLVREVARNRGDVAVIKEGLGRMAHSVAEQGRHLAPATTTEGRMIETIVTQLGALGETPRAQAQTPQASEILQLEMAPPPARPTPVSELDSALGTDFSKFSDAVVSDLVRQGLRQDRIDVFLQPVVSLPQRKPRMLEAYARIRAGAGAYLPAGRYLETAAREDMLPAIDNALLLRCLEMLRDRRNADTTTPYILNVSGATLTDRRFMGDLVAFLSQHHKMAGRLIFELPQAELEQHAGAVAPLLDGLSKLGCRFSMDRVRSRTFDIARLKAMHIRFIKMDAGWLIAEGATKAGFSRIARLKRQLDLAGIDLIAERIEDEQTLRELLDFHVDFGQGYLFGKPDHYAAFRQSRIAAAA